MKIAIFSIFFLLHYYSYSVVAQDKYEVSLSTGYILNNHNESLLRYWNNGYFISANLHNNLDEISEIVVGISFNNFFFQKKYFRVSMVDGWVAETLVDDLKSMEINGLLNINFSKNIICPYVSIGLGGTYFFGGNIYQKILYGNNMSGYDELITNSKTEKWLFNLSLGTGIGYRLSKSLNIVIDGRVKIFFSPKDDPFSVFPIVAFIKYVF